LATNVTPLTDHIVLQAVEQEEYSASGLVIPDSAKEKPQHGHVLAVGPGKRNEKGDLDSMDLAPGDRVLYQKYTGQEVSVGTEDYIIIRFQDVLAKLEEEAPKAAAKTARPAAKKAAKK
jgi:chaperonin GroES